MIDDDTGLRETSIIPETPSPQAISESPKKKTVKHKNRGDRGTGTDPIPHRRRMEGEYSSQPVLQTVRPEDRLSAPLSTQGTPWTTSRVRMYFELEEELWKSIRQRMAPVTSDLRYVRAQYFPEISQTWSRPETCCGNLPMSHYL